MKARARRLEPLRSTRAERLGLLHLPAAGLPTRRRGVGGDLESMGIEPNVRKNMEKHEKTCRNLKGRRRDVTEFRIMSLKRLGQDFGGGCRSFWDYKPESEEET